MHPNEVLGFPLPELQNTSSNPITIESFDIAHVPQGVTVEKFKLLSVKDTHGVLLGSFPATDGGRYGYAGYPDYLPEHPVIPAGKISIYYPVVYLKVTAQTSAMPSGCVYVYSVAGQEKKQTAECSFHLEPAP